MAMKCSTFVTSDTQFYLETVEFDSKKSDQKNLIVTHTHLINTDMEPLRSTHPNLYIQIQFICVFVISRVID